MSIISDAILETLLDEITDYTNVNLSGDELATLQSASDQWEDKESIESEINQHLKKFGFKYDSEKCEWVREKLILPIDRNTFVEFYYSDQSSSALRDMAYEVINAISEDGVYKVTIQDLFNNCGYFRIGHLDISSELDEQLRDAFEDDEIEGSCGVILGKEYEIVLKSD